MIDLVDARSQKLVWRAYCVAEGTGMSDPAFIQKAVNKAFEHFPPPRGAERDASTAPAAIGPGRIAVVY